MNGEWQGAQWVLATLLAASVILPPLIRYGAIMNGFEPKNDWPDFFGRRLADLIAKMVLVAILIWGGFF